MNKKEAKSKLEIIEWCNGMDEQVILMKPDEFDFDDCYILFYGSDDEERDYMIWIIMCDEDVVAYGYSSD